MTRDFTDRKRAEEAVMLQLSSALLANMDVSRLLGAISASIREVIPHERRRWRSTTRRWRIAGAVSGPDDADVGAGDVRVPRRGFAGRRSISDP